MRGLANSVAVLQPRRALFHGEQFRSPGTAPGDGLHVAVVFTNREGTQAALRMAGNLAKGLGARIRLLAVHEVPFSFPLDKPPVSLDFLERSQISLVSESDVRAEKVDVELFLCYDRAECLKRILKPGSLVLVGGKRRRWLNKARRLERWLGHQGHRVIFAEAKTHSAVIPQFRGAMLHRIRAWLSGNADSMRGGVRTTR